MRVFVYEHGCELLCMRMCVQVAMLYPMLTMHVYVQDLAKQRTEELAQQVESGEEDATRAGEWGKILTPSGFGPLSGAILTSVQAFVYVCVCVCVRA
jgi:hypothetical protein